MHFGSIFMPDTGLRQTLNQRLASHVFGHESLELLLKGLLSRMNRVGLRQVSKGPAGLVIGRTRSPFDGLLDGPPCLGGILGQVLQI